MKIAYLIGSSDFDASFFQAELAQHTNDEQYLVGVDRGTRRLLALGYEMDLAVGDFDSIREAERREVKAHAKQFIALNPEKDLTDTESALHILLSDFPVMDEYRFYAMLGGRLDHTLHNIWMGFDPEYRDVIDRFHFVSPDDMLSFYTPGEYTLKREPRMTYLSFIAMETVSDLTLQGPKYPLDHYRMTYPQSFISNEFLTDEMTFSFSEGKLLVLQTRDSAKI